MNIIISINIPELWSGNFVKSKWGAINFFVGANGTGKTMFANKLFEELINNGLKARKLNSERLAGFENFNSSSYISSGFEHGINRAIFEKLKKVGAAYGLSTDAYIILTEKLDIKVRIEALLSDFFKKKIRLNEEGGFIVPKMQNKFSNNQYNLKEKECHGLKELITLLTYLYDDEFNCLIIDEPELHLHPQFQSFLMEEIKRVAGNPNQASNKKCIFIITHSPYFLEVNKLSDLENVIVFHTLERNILPTYYEITEFDEFNDTYEKEQLQRFLQKFNTHHKQLFFSKYPLFVEGYTDRQIISILLERLKKNIGAIGSSVIDVDGKDQVYVLFKLCNRLKIDARFLVDLDALFKGKISQLIQKEIKCQTFCRENAIDPSRIHSDLITILDRIKNDLIIIQTIDPDIKHIIDVLSSYDSDQERHNQRKSILLALKKYKNKIEHLLPNKQGDITQVLSIYKKYIEALEKINIYILEKGEIENYYTQNKIDYLKYNKDYKNRYFEDELKYLLESNNTRELQENYDELIKILDKAIPFVDTSIRFHLRSVVIEWLQKVQHYVDLGELKNEKDIKTYSDLNYSQYSQIFTLISFNLKEKNSFECKIKIKSNLLSNEETLSFNERTTPIDFWV